VYAPLIFPEIVMAVVCVLKRANLVRLVIVIFLMSMTALTVALPRSAKGDSSSYPTHEPIVINGDSDFTSANGVTGGTGTASDPYIIEGWSISVCCRNPGILIHDTTDYFVIRSVHVYSTDWYFYSINMTSVANGALENSQSTDYQWSLIVDSSSNILVSNDVINQVNIVSSENVTVSESGFAHSFVTATSSSNITLTSNTLPELPFGISIVNSTGVTVQNNTLSQILLRETSAEQLDSITITSDNTANGQPLLFYKDSSELNLDSMGSGELIVATSSNVTITNFRVAESYGFSIVEMAFDSNAVLENITGAGKIMVTGSTQVRISDYSGQISVDSSDQVQLSNNSIGVGGSISVSSSSHVSITNNLHYSIVLADSSNITISDNNLAAGCCTTDFTGLRIESSDHVTISRNNFHSDWAILVKDSNFLGISDNRILDAGYGAIIMNNCWSASIKGNDVQTSCGAGGTPPIPAIGVSSSVEIDVSNNNITHSTDPLAISLSSNISIQSNNISNSTTAVGVADSSNITITGNNIQSNQQGVVLKITTNVQVFHNNFLNNTVQATDVNSTLNVWDNGYPSGGNYWSDYTGVDNCSGPNQDVCPSPDGIGDTPYIFSYNQDNYPLMNMYSGQ